MAKRSFDIGRNKPETPVKRRRRRRRKSESETQKNTHPRLATRAPKKKLRDRRRDAQTQKALAILLGVALVAGAIIYVFWLPAIRISAVEAKGMGDPDTITLIAKSKLTGTYGGVVPRDSFFFYPERAIREAVLAEYPAVAAVSVTRNGFTSLLIQTSERVSAFWWCGSPASLAAEDTGCYHSDSEGFLYAQVDPAEAASSTVEHLRVYANLDAASSTNSYPIRATVLGAARLPDILRFIRAVKALSVPVASVAIRGDEADLFVPPSTRITYVVGHEREAAGNAQAALPKLNLVDGSIQYVDLRFDGKVYVKRVGE